jgi:hypothetical protein
MGFVQRRITEVFRVVSSGQSQTSEVFNPWSGFSYEIAPSLLFNAGNIEIEFGIACDGFPEIGSFKNSVFWQTEYRKSYRWNPIGLRIGMEF